MDHSDDERLLHEQPFSRAATVAIVDAGGGHDGSAAGAPATGFGERCPRPLSRQRCFKLGVEGGRSIPLPDCNV